MYYNIQTEYVTEIVAWYTSRYLALICVGFDWLAHLGCWDSIWPLKTFRDITGSLGSTTLIWLAFSSWWMIPSISSSDFRRLNITVHTRGWGQRQPKGGTLFSRERSWVSGSPILNPFLVFDCGPIEADLVLSWQGHTTPTSGTQTPRTKAWYERKWNMNNWRTMNQQKKDKNMTKCRGFLFLWSCFAYLHISPFRVMGGDLGGKLRLWSRVHGTCIFLVCIGFTSSRSRG